MILAVRTVLLLVMLVMLVIWITGSVLHLGSLRTTRTMLHYPDCIGSL